MDKIFKIGILILGTIFVLLYYSDSKKGRYEMNEIGTLPAVFDTQTGTVYVAVIDEWKKIIPQKSVRFRYINNEWVQETITGKRGLGTKKEEAPLRRLPRIGPKK